MRWKPKPTDNLQRENDALKTTIVCLRRDLSNKAQFVDRLEFLLRERMETIDALHSTIDRLREQNRRLDEEAEHLAQLVSAEGIPPG
jgi:FtsZ-binding cell division protein ZapB